LKRVSLTDLATLQPKIVTSTATKTVKIGNIVPEPEPSAQVLGNITERKCKGVLETSC